MSQPSFNPHGAVDLSSLSRPVPASPGPATDGAPSGAVGVVVDVTEAEFQSLVVEQSMTVPVVIDFWADWCGPCKQLSPVLEKLAVADAGRWLLAKIDVDANQRLGQAFQVQGIPAVFAVVKGQPIPLFQGALPETQVREYLDELLRVAEANGVSGRLAAGDAPPAAAEEEPAVDPRYDEAYDAIERGDLEAAAAAYRSLLDSAPDDADARAAAAADPDDVDAQCRVADLDLLGGHVEDAFGRLVDLVRRTAGDDRDRARTHLVGLFDLVGNQDDRVVVARTALANALF